MVGKSSPWKILQVAPTTGHDKTHRNTIPERISLAVVYIPVATSLKASAWDNGATRRILTDEKLWKLEHRNSHARAWCSIVSSGRRQESAFVSEDSALRSHAVGNGLAKPGLDHLSRLVESPDIQALHEHRVVEKVDRRPWSERGDDLALPDLALGLLRGLRASAGLKTSFTGHVCLLRANPT
jgi:hypothetical protein